MSKKILVVDDEKTIRELLKMFFQRCGMDVLTAENGEFGVSLFEKNTVDIIISDIDMPVMKGIEMAKKIREKKGGKKVAIVFVSGNTDNEIRKEAEQVKPAGFFEKPLDLFELLDFIKKI